jgi:hypothetical protein
VPTISNLRQKSLRAFLAFFGVIGGMALVYFTLSSVVFAVLLAFALIAAPMTLGMGFVYAGQARKQAQMERGEGILARWTLDPGTWHAFEALNTSLDAQKPWLKPRRAFKGAVPASGVEVVFMDDTLFAAGEPCSLDRALSPTATLHASWIEFELTTSGEPETYMLRVPFGPEAQSDAERIVRHFNALRRR